MDKKASIRALSPKRWSSKRRDGSFLFVLDTEPRVYDCKNLIETTDLLQGAVLFQRTAFQDTAVHYSTHPELVTARALQVLNARKMDDDRCGFSPTVAEGNQCESVMETTILGPWFWDFMTEGLPSRG
jgi:hypothetical protein